MASASGMEEALRRPLPLITEKYSLEPDMIFGWRPTQLKQKAPIPLKFRPTQKRSREIYNAPHPFDSFVLHQAFRKQSAYKFDFNDSLISAVAYISKKNAARSPDTRSFVRMASKVPRNSLHFNSDFESGNLDKVTLVTENQYDLLLRSDTNSHTGGLWFYFEVKNITYSRTVELNILNLPSAVTLFDNGYRPVVHSELINSSNEDIGWEKFQGNFRYSRSKFTDKQAKHPLYQITLELELTVNDTVKIAASVPYTCSSLHSFLATVPPTHTKISHFCESLSGVPVPLVTITNREVPKSSKKYVFILSRIHPEETYTSHIAEGAIEFLSSQDQYAKMLRDRVIFKILPMANPDGVIAGNSRNSFAGRDLNKCFKRKNPALFPITCSFYQLIKKRARNNQVFLFVDIRAQHKKKGTFVYGPYYPIHDRMYYQSKIIPKVFSEKTCMFRYYSCRYAHKENQACGVFEKEFAVLSYSLVNSMHSYLDENRETREYTFSEFREIGETLCLSTLEYLIMLEENKRREQERAKKRYVQLRSSDSKPKQFMTIQHVIDNIKNADKNLEIDSDLGEWSDHEDDYEDDNILTQISTALDEFHSFTTKKATKHPDAEQKPKVPRRPEFLKAGYPRQRGVSKPAVNFSLYSLGPETRGEATSSYSALPNKPAKPLLLPMERPLPYSKYRKFGPFPFIKSRIKYMLI